MNGDGGDKQQHLVQARVAVGLRIGSHQPVQMGHQLINEVQAHRTGKDAGDGNRNAEPSAVIEGRQNQSQHRRGKHNPRGKGQHNIGEFVRDVPKDKAHQASENRRAAHTQGRQQHHFHIRFHAGFLCKSLQSPFSDIQG